MKVAFWNPTPLVNGVTTWLWEARKGLIANGVTCDIIYNSRSGKVLKPWTSKGLLGKSTRHVRDVDLPDVFDEYDLVVLAEARYIQMDKVNPEVDDLPWYLRVLNATKAEYTAIVHGPHNFGGPFSQALVSQVGYVGWLLATSRRWVTDVVDTRVVEVPFLPYEFNSDRQPTFEEKDVIMTARVISSKGQLALTKVAQRLRRDVRLHGESASMGAGGTYSAQLYQRLVKQGLKPFVEHEGMGPEPWSLRNQYGYQFVYLGRYEGGDRSVYDDARVHLSLTHSVFANDHLEYATLEAIDNRVPIVLVPRAQVPDDMLGHYRGLRTLERFSTSSDFDEDELVQALDVQHVAEPELLRQDAEKLHAPERAMRALVELL